MRFRTGPIVVARSFIGSSRDPPRWMGLRAHPQLIRGSHVNSFHPVLERILLTEEASSFATLSELDALLDSESERSVSVCSLPCSELSERDVEMLRVRFFGKKSVLHLLLAQLKGLPATDRKEAGARINRAKATIEERLKVFFEECRSHQEQSKLAAEVEDITLPLPPQSFGSRHPVSVTARDLLMPLRRMGFAIVDGPEIESDFYNFEALNLPKEHPAREMQDTFFVAAEWVLRTHTSSVQVHALKERGVPLRIACPGYTFRNEYDLTHIPTFRQIEGLVVDRGVHLGHLRYTLNMFFNEVFGRPVKMRLRSSYFPFTEPSAEMDVQCQQCLGAGCRACKQTGWLEMGGCGLVHRKVLDACGVPSEFSGFAFGMGVDRIAMSKYGISDLRALTEGDVSFLRPFQLS
jgi:phenylalanyl-tRNA synthetase alpha chain